MYFLIFIPAPSSQEKQGFLSFYSFDQKHHGISTRCVLLICKANFTIMRVQRSKRSHSFSAIPAFPRLSLSDSRIPIALRCVVSRQPGGSCFSLSAHGRPPHVYKLHAFLPSGPHPTFSAHIQLPACCNIPTPRGVWTLSILSEAEGQQFILCNCFRLSVQVQISLLSVRCRSLRIAEVESGE